MQGQRETNASNTSLIDDIYDDIMLNEEKRKKTYNIKDYSIKVVEEKEEEEQPKEHGIFKNIFSKQENQYKSNGPVLEVDGKKVYTKSDSPYNLFRNNIGKRQKILHSKPWDNSMYNVAVFYGIRR